MITLIGISGHAGSGKNTVANIIQQMTAGYEPTSEQWRHVAKGSMSVGISEWKQRSFAGKLKEIASLLTGIPAYKFDDQEFKNSVLGPEWNYSESYGPLTRGFKVHQMTVREFLQRLGTDAVRKGLHDRTWINALFSDYRPGNVGGYPEYGITESGERIAIGYNSFVEFPKWVITDTRFPDEAKAIKDRGGVVVRVNQMTAEDWRDIGNGRERTPHVSETALDDYKFDYVIQNNAGIDELVEKVREMLEHFSIINKEG